MRNDARGVSHCLIPGKSYRKVAVMSNMYPKELQDISKRFSSDRVEVHTEEVTVLADDSVLDKFVSDVFNDLEERWSASHWTSEFGVSRNDLRRYLITAIESRVKFVRRERATVRTNDQWYLPAPFAQVVNMLGIVDLEAPVKRVVPAWNSAYDPEVLSPSEFVAVGMRLKKLEVDPDVKVILIHALEKDKRGFEPLMRVFRRVNEQGETTAIHGKQPVDAIAATCFLILGMNPELQISEPLSEIEKESLPYFIPEPVTHIVMQVLSEVQGAKAS